MLFLECSMILYNAENSYRILMVKKTELVTQSNNFVWKWKKQIHSISISENKLS